MKLKKNEEKRPVPPGPKNLSTSSINPRRGGFRNYTTYYVYETS